MRSDAIVVSFGFQWYERLKQCAFTAVIRKRIPIGVQPRWLYFHVNAPKSAICARAKISSVEHIGLAEAGRDAESIAMRPADIGRYFGARGAIGIYRLGAIEHAEHEVSSGELRTLLSYHAPQSFFVLSIEGRRVVDDLCNFGAVGASVSRVCTDALS